MFQYGSMAVLGLLLRRFASLLCLWKMRGGNSLQQQNLEEINLALAFNYDFQAKIQGSFLSSLCW